MESRTTCTVPVLSALLAVAAMSGSASADVTITRPACDMPSAFFEELATSIDAVVAGASNSGEPPDFKVECSDVEGGLRILISLTSSDGKAVRTEREVSKASALAQVRAIVKSLLVVEPPKNAEGPPPMPTQDREEVLLTPRAAKLKKIQAIEGDEFSQEKYGKYGHLKAGGIVLTAVGFPVFLVTSLVFALSADPGGWVDTNDKEPPRSDAQEIYRGVAWATLVTSFVSLCVGVPLAISGAHGKRRQLYLRDNAQPAPVALEVDLRGIGFTF